MADNFYPLPNTPAQNAAWGPNQQDPDGIAKLSLVQPVVSPEFTKWLLVTMEDGSHVLIEKNPPLTRALYKSTGAALFEAYTKDELDTKLSRLTNDRFGLTSFKPDVSTPIPPVWPDAP